MSEGLRERKKRETRERISDIATGLFLMRGFDNVTVAEVARAADVSVNTVFNYFPTKEDLLFDRQEEVESLPGKVVRERKPGESALEALRRDFLDALDTRHHRYGFHEGSDTFHRMLSASPSLNARLREMDEAREQSLAGTLADEIDADPDDLAPAFVAAQICAVLRRLTSYAVQRMLAGEAVDAIAPDLRHRAHQAFDLLESGIGDYGVRRESASQVTGSGN
ncbi:TetR/AcrR family transcriptional regulator [Streptosporangium sp. 'caverna']|uniref:TetR/AcrR family transcriptional regulator n=1 Tax=Streptosporangium sp. 'caverna' TaxID=2202249 RepID=UPI000D7D4A0B|nr:TetR family transcriptional regulator [Streptosporangium sp. 'caverna']AWS44718.1 TetR family transcriptional regulator [Streptosporangium sp. 'caverna']